MTRWVVVVLLGAALTGCGSEPPAPVTTPSRLPLSETPTDGPSTPSPTAVSPTSPAASSPGPTSTPSTVLGTLATEETYGVGFVLPEGWERLDEGTPRWHGDDGYVQLDAVSDDATSAEDACVALSEHSLEPYGSAPTIETVVIDGQEGCLVLPSDDQAPELERQAAIVARYPQAREIGGEAYEFVALYVDEPHVHAIASTLRFIN